MSRFCFGFATRDWGGGAATAALVRRNERRFMRSMVVDPATASDAASSRSSMDSVVFFRRVQRRECAVQEQVVRDLQRACDEERHVHQRRPGEQETREDGGERGSACSRDTRNSRGGGALVKADDRHRV